MHDLGAEDHEQRAVPADDAVKRIEQSVGAAFDRANRPQRGMHHEHIAGRDAEAAEVFG
jgi:hypothetical protein